MKLKKIFAVTAAVITAVSMSLCAVGCSGEPDDYTPPKNTDEYIIPQDYCRTYYEVFVRSFADGNKDGIGDLRGLANNLDYLNDGDDSTASDLGINGIWMMPINMSPSYHKYDVSDYYAIDDEYGTMEDFDYLVSECNKRGIWLQMDLVLNHTSSEHAWFKAAVADARNGVLPDDSTAMSRYSFVKGAKPSAYSNKWYKVSGTSDYWYFGNFSEFMPDLNLANEGVRDEIKNIVDFWLDKGIHSFRLDAVPSAFGSSDSASYSAENGEFWTWFNDYCNQKGEEVYGEEDDGINSYCYNVGEVWTSSRSTIIEYFGTGMSNFNYPLANSYSSGFGGVVNGKSAATLIEVMQKTQRAALAVDPDALISNFLSNHDNDRSGQGLFGSNASKIKRGAALYILSPGNPYIYYGEEIGAKGYGRDENKRLAFNWGDSRNVMNPTDADYEGKQTFGSVKSQTKKADSILSYYREVIKLRNRFPEIGRGNIAAYALNEQGVLTETDEIRDIITNDGALNSVNELNNSIAAYTLEWNDRKVLIVHNIGNDSATVNASAFIDYEIVATLKADGGSVSFDGGVLTMSGGTVAVLKVKAPTEGVKAN